MKRYQERTPYTMRKSNRMAELAKMGYNLERDDILFDISALSQEWLGMDVSLLSPMAIKKLHNILELNVNLPDHAKFLSSEEAKMIVDKLDEYEKFHKEKNVCVFVDFLEQSRDNFYGYGTSEEDYVIEQNKANSFENNSGTVVIGLDRPDVYYLINDLNDESELNEMVDNTNIKRTNKITFPMKKEGEVND